jgi:hypothetical protein
MRLRPLIVALVLATAACDAGYTAPADAAGRYALVTYGDAPLPLAYGVVVTVPVGGGTVIVCDRALAADTLALGTMRFTRRQVFTTTCGGTVVPPSQVSVSNGAYTLVDGLITFTYDIAAESPLGAVYTVQGKREGDAITVRRTSTIPQDGVALTDSTVLRYERAR